MGVAVFGSKRDALPSYLVCVLWMQSGQQEELIVPARSLRRRRRTLSKKDARGFIKFQVWNARHVVRSIVNT